VTSRVIIGLAIAAGLAVPLVFRGQGPIQPRPKASAKTTQAAKQDDEVPANIKVDSTLVLVPVEVSDALNRPVSGLEKENFHVFDDKIEQKIVSFAMEDDPIAVGLVFDVSGSMERDIPQTRLAASTFFKTANPEDEFCLVALASEAKLVVPLTTTPGDIGDKLLFTKPGGSTALLDGIYLALNEVRKSKKLRKALVIISDGGDNNSRYTQTEVRNAIRETDTLIYAIGVFGNGAGSNYSDQEVLTSLTKESGGRLFPTNGMAIADFAAKIITDLRNRYVLGYSPTNPTKDGRYHRLDVKLAPPKGLPKLSAHWKTGYFAAGD
jgi:Ca-activated chloride channel family protein